MFEIDTTDKLLPAGQNACGSTFFNNTGETKRRCIETGLAFRPLTGLDVSFAYTHSDFEFETLVVSGISFVGEKIPGIPEQTGFMELAYYHPSGFYSVFDFQYVDEVFVNNTYTDDPDLGASLIPRGESADDYTLINLRMGYTANTGGKIEFTLFFGINNLFDWKYIGHVRVNEARHKYSEPAPEHNFFAGLSVRYQ